MKLFLLLIILVFASIAHADNIVVPANRGVAYLKAADGKLYPVTVVYTTDGAGHLVPVNGPSPTATPTPGPSPSPSP